MSGVVSPTATRRSVAQKRGVMKRSLSENGYAANGKPSSPAHQSAAVERTVKKLRLSKVLTIPEGTTVSDACRKMAARRIDAVLLTDSNALLSGIATDKDITTRVIAEELRPDQTLISKVMTRNPTFVSADSLAIDALQKMVQGKFRHLPVVENGEVIAMLDITKCLYDAISKLEKAAEQDSAIAAAVEGVERQFGSNSTESSALIETLRERMFKPSLSTIISEIPKVAIVLPSDPVYVAAKRMQESRVNSVLIMTGNTIQGILTSKDILMRVVALNLSPELTLVEKVMTPDPQFATLETTILEALQIMRDRKFLHLPVVDKDGNVAACVDVLQLTHAALSLVENSSGTVDDVHTTMQKFWDSALNLDLPDDGDTVSEMSTSQYLASDAGEHLKSPTPVGNSFSFKFKDSKGRLHRFNLGTESLTELVSAVTQRVDAPDEEKRPQILYEDDEGDKIVLTSDGDLAGAVTHARSTGQKVLRVHLEYYEERQELSSTTTATERRRSNLRYGILAGTAVVAGTGVLVYLKRSKA